MANLLKRSSLLQSLVRIRGNRAATAVADDTLSLHCYRRFLGTASASVSARTASSTALSEPWLMLPPDNGMAYKFYSLAEGQVISLNKLKGETDDDDDHCVGSSHGWLAYVSSRDCSFYLLNPLSSHKKNLPSLEILPFVKGAVRDPKTYTIHGFLIGNNSSPLSSFITPQDLCKSAIHLLVLSSEDIEDENCIAFIIYRGSRLAFCRPARDTTWTLLQSPLQSESAYQKIVYAATDGLFYTLTHHLELESWDLRDPCSPKRFQIHNPFFGFRGSLRVWPAKVSDVDEYFWRALCLRQGYLVSDPSSGDILLVIRYVADGITKNGEIIRHCENLDGKLPYKTVAFDVFKLVDFTPSVVGDFYSDDKDVIIELLDTLGDRSLFIGPYHCFTLSAKDFPMLKSNFIYFTDDGTWSTYRMSLGRYGGHDLGIYNYEDSHIEPCYFPLDLDSIRQILPVPTCSTKVCTPDDVEDILMPNAFL